ncbi:MAG: elongation factor P [Chloroflexi bacterium RBG_16_60_22]|nr:MAG: elongation factor P [Chloroflexi bacterium RBG_16_60_22]
MINATELRKGVIIEFEGKLYQVVEHQHVKMKRTALSKVKLRDISAGHTIERSIQSDEKLVRARLDTVQMQYLYNDGDLYYFMDQETYEQMPLTREQLGDGLDYLKEGNSVEVTSHKGKVVGVTLPITVELEVTQADPGFKGDTATAGSKPAKLETGVTIHVPLFVNEGDVIKVDTRTGTYLERSS